MGIVGFSTTGRVALTIRRVKAGYMKVLTVPHFRTCEVKIVKSTKHLGPSYSSIIQNGNAHTD